MRSQRFILPATTYDTLAKIISAYANHGERMISASDLRHLNPQGPSKDDISRSARFLVSIDIIQKVKGTEYQPTPAGLALGLAIKNSNRDAIQKCWRQIVMGELLFNTILEMITNAKRIEKSKLKKIIANMSDKPQIDGTRKDHAFDTQAPCVIDILSKAGKVSDSSGFVEMAEEANEFFLDPVKIERMRNLESIWDLSRLVKYCEEINDNYSPQNFYSMLFVLRAIQDHIPPIFHKKHWDDLVATASPNPRHPTLKNILSSLDMMRKIADLRIHGRVKTSDVPLSPHSIKEFKLGFDELLSYIIEELEGASKERSGVINND